jgi:hypothetical protein
MAETRRRILEIGASAVALGLSGCAGIGGGGDGDGNSGDGDENDDGDDEEVSAPAVHWEFEERDTELVITHGGGDGVSVDSLRIRGPVENQNPSGSGLSTGGHFTVQLTDEASSGDTIQIVYRDPDGNETVIGEYTLSG